MGRLRQTGVAEAMLERRLSHCYKGQVSRLAFILALLLSGGSVFGFQSLPCHCPPSCADDEPSSSGGADCPEVCCASPRSSVTVRVLSRPVLAPVSAPVATVERASPSPDPDDIFHVPKFVRA